MERGTYTPRPDLVTKIKEAGVSYRDLAATWGCALPTARARLNGNCPLTSDHIRKLTLACIRARHQTKESAECPPEAVTENSETT